MPLHLLDGMGKVRDEDLTEFSVWIEKDTAKEAEAPKDPDEAADELPEEALPEEREEARAKAEAYRETVEEIRLFIRPMSGYELERAGNKTGIVKGKGRGDGKEKRTDGTASLDHIAKILVRIEPAPVNEAGQPQERVTLDVVRGLPAWLIMRLTQHMDLVKQGQAEKEKN